MKIDAVLWDYDGTLVNSVPKNIDITKKILAEVAPRLTGEDLPKYLKNEDAYHIANHKSKNWQDLYLNYYGMSDAEMIIAGSLWTEYQLKNTTPVELYPQIKELINQISIPQAICSQNSSKNIFNVLKQNNILHKFQSIIGYDDIPKNVQKPNPFGGIKCLREIFNNTDSKTIFYIGDHEGDVIFARNISKELGKQNNIVSIAVKYSGADIDLWGTKPDFEICQPLDIINIMNKYT
ncbi:MULTISPECIES: HAD family hydrolase [Elizabethkingia]|uniref:HAD family hydrolase n=1 Tax=Elizabethkingia TaxID=308865 RepID=UPI00099A918A|nr:MULTISPECIES: HAD hydrolase-like protein [Elizabethkingia]AQX87859.1 phosphatase [Elizabethkingia anophelis]MCT3846003.1 HAD family hydrolase [Elizabethkingia anophelis]MCT4152196.1 HAD family hydrolase [Elizabethkingia anophelis]MCT4216989.1 HAD family hydrolase [Elizabethkingia anophelis]MDV3713144.1 HAD family hydrolase [Elizabethkingia anophelis]